MGLTKTIYKYLFSNLLTKIHVFIYLKDIIWGDDSMEEKVKQWYEETPELMEAEKAAMEMLAKDDYKKLLFLKDGRACWYIGFNSKLSGRKYYVVLVYPENHPAQKCVYTDIKAYLIEPTYEILLDEMNLASGDDYECMPYSIHDEYGEWHLSLGETETAYKTMCDRNVGTIIASAANVLLATKDWIEFYEKGVANKGVGFYRSTIIEPEVQKKACIECFGAPAIKYYKDIST